MNHYLDIAGESVAQNDVDIISNYYLKELYLCFIIMSEMSTSRARDLNKQKYVLGYRHTAGFTLIELLVVIVVIAILATVSVIAYSGIQDRAKNASIETALRTYVNALQMYAQVNGKFPTPSDVPGGSGWGWWAICLGQENDYPASASFTQGTCSVGNRALNLANQGDVKTSPELQSQLAQFITKSPSIEALSDNRLSSYPIRGMIYTPWYSDGKTAQLDYALWGKNRKCANGWANSGYFSDATRCSFMLTAP